MEGIKRELQVLTAGLLFAIGIGQAAAAQDGTAAGTLTLNGAAVTLTHAYATAQPGILDAKSEDVHVILSSMPLSEEMRADSFGLLRLARDGKAAFVEVIVDARGEALSGAIYAKAFNGMASLSGMHQFQREKLERGLISGRLFMDGSRSFMDVTYHYDARFSAPIPRALTPDELAAALASPPAIAAGRYVEAIRKGDFAAFVATLATAAAAGYSGADGQARFAQLRKEMPPDTRPVMFKTQPDGSVLVSVEGRQNGVAVEYVLKMVEEAGRWKVGK